MNLIGLPAGTRLPSLSNSISRTWLVEWINFRNSPGNLYDAMKAERMKNRHMVSALLGGKGTGGKRLNAY
jgi:hypothetical protein